MFLWKYIAEIIPNGAPERKANVSVPVAFGANLYKTRFMTPMANEVMNAVL
jgi:hypothetical protein